MPNHSYIPINCSFYDELEALATLRKDALISYAGEDEQTLEARGKIKDFFIREGAEFLKLDTGKEIRLDYIKSVNGKLMGDAC